MSAMMPALIIAMEQRQRRARLAEALIPAMMPVAASQRMAIAAMAASQQVRDAESREQRIAGEVVTAVQTVVNKPAGQPKVLSETDLNALGMLQPVLIRVPGLLDQIQTTGATLVTQQQVDARIVTIAREAAEALEIAVKNPKDQKLTAADLKGTPALAELINNLKLGGNIFV